MYNKENRNILITGSNGFIGNHVANYFKKNGYYVIGLGRSIEPFDANSVNEYISCDMNSGKMSQLPQLVSVNIDAVIHLAADMRKEPFGVDVISANCCGTQRLLEMCEQNGIKTFLQLSSLPVIGHPINHPITEEHPLHPYTIYHITKKTEEMLAEYACTYHGIRTASFRISAPIGPRVNPKTIFPTFVRNALAGKDLVLLGQGARKQNYVSVKDIARCLELSLLSPQVCGVYNLTSDILVSNLELAQAIIRVLNSNSKIIFNGEDPQDTYIWDASLQKLKEASGYQPTATLDGMIQEYASWLGTHQS